MHQDHHIDVPFASDHYTRDLYCSLEAVDAIERWYAAALERLPLAADGRYVETCVGRTHVLITGNPAGPPLVLIHGLNNNALIWEPQWAALSDFHIFALDVPGQPGRSDPRRPSLLNNDYVHWLSDILDALDLPVVSIVGLSMGALIALRFAAQKPAQVQQLVLLSPAGISRLRPGVTARIIAVNLPFHDFDAGMRELMRYIFVTPGVESPVDTSSISEFLELTARYQKPIVRPRAIIENTVCGLPLPARTLRKVRAPCTVLIGEQDVMFSASQVIGRANRLLSNVIRAEIIPDSGHAMIYEQPEQVNAVLNEVLNV